MTNMPWLCRLKSFSHQWLKLESRPRLSLKHTDQEPTVWAAPTWTLHLPPSLLGSGHDSSSFPTPAENLRNGDMWSSRLLSIPGTALGCPNTAQQETTYWMYMHTYMYRCVCLPIWRLRWAERPYYNQTKTASLGSLLSALQSAPRHSVPLGNWSMNLGTQDPFQCHRVSS